MSYDMIDRFLRNNLGDEDYAEYSAALDAAYTPQRKPLTDDEILSIARNHYNPHQRPEISFARAIEAAHGIKENT